MALGIVSLFPQFSGSRSPPLPLWRQHGVKIGLTQNQTKSHQPVVERPACVLLRPLCAGWKRLILRSAADSTYPILQILYFKISGVTNLTNDKFHVNELRPESLLVNPKLFIVSLFCL